MKRIVLAAAAVVLCGLLPAQAQNYPAGHTCIYNTDCLDPLVCSAQNFCQEPCHQDNDCKFDLVGILHRPQGGHCRNVTFVYDSQYHATPVDPRHMPVTVGDRPNHFGPSAADYNVCIKDTDPAWAVSRPPMQPGLPRSVTVQPGGRSDNAVVADGAGVQVQAAIPAGQLLTHIDMPGDDMSNAPTFDDQGAACRQSCVNDTGCRAFTWVRPGVQGRDAVCWLKSAVPHTRIKSDNANSGIVRP